MLLPGCVRGRGYRRQLYYHSLCPIRHPCQCPMRPPVPAYQFNYELSIYRPTRICIWKTVLAGGYGPVTPLRVSPSLRKGTSLRRSYLPVLTCSTATATQVLSEPYYATRPTRSLVLNGGWCYQVEWAGAEEEAVRVWLEVRRARYRPTRRPVLI
eukprot:3649475-Rhodomonas_salina.1